MTRRKRCCRVLDVLEALAAPYSVFSRVMPQVIAIVAVTMAAAFVFMKFQGLDLISALYAAVGLVTTIGLYTPPISAMPEVEKAVLTVLVASSVAIYTTLVSNIIRTLTTRAVWIDARARWRAAHMEGHVVILGDLVEAAQELDKYGVEYVMVTKDASLVNRLGARRVILGDPTSEAELRAANVDKASAVIVALDNDLDNLVALIRVRAISTKARTVVLIHHDDLIDVFKSAGANSVIRSRRLLSRAIVGLALSGNIGGLLLESTEASSRALTRHGHGIGFFEVKKGSACDGLAISSLPKGVTPILVEREGRFTPYFTPDMKLRAGDYIVVIGDPSSFKELEEMCGGGEG
ncbi:MAG: potassium channel family protein [Acidilobus sp.]